MRVQHLNHSTYQHEYHIVWATKYRRQFLQEYVKPELQKSLHETIKKYPTLYLITANTDKDHVHLQIEIPPNIAVSDAVSKLKAHASLHLRQRFKFIREMYLEKDGIWSVGYFSSAIGLNERQIRQYITWQSEQEKPQTIRMFFPNKMIVGLSFANQGNPGRRDAEPGEEVIVVLKKLSVGVIPFTESSDVTRVGLPCSGRP